MFAIVDIEATGGNPRKDRITEIAVFVHNGERVIEQYCTLVNPGTYISPFITALTGISNEMVAEAPKWEEIIDKVEELTKGRVFVAHNVRFDYAFLCNEYRRIGRRFQRKNLCTVRLSRALLPHLTSYSLGRLCDQVGIPVEHRHRAFGDGAATAELFNVLLNSDGHGIIRDSLKDEINQSIMPPNLRREAVDELPEETGVYYFHDERGKILYIGKSTNIRQRIISHLSGDMNSERYHELKAKLHSITYELTGNELVALLLESSEIKRWMPPFNYAQRRKKFRYGVYRELDAHGYVNLVPKLLQLEGNPIFTSSSKIGVYSALRVMAEKHNLCLKKCRVDEEEAENCLHHTVGICEGACVGVEDVNSYNAKVSAALYKFEYEKTDFAIVAEGRTPLERAIICVENGVYRGFGFVNDAEERSYTYDDLLSAVQPAYDHPDLHRIIRSFMKKGKKGHAVVYREV
jgi:DNA polymerase III subunit epsilon